MRRTYLTEKGMMLVQEHNDEPLYLGQRVKTPTGEAILLGGLPDANGPGRVYLDEYGEDYEYPPSIIGAKWITDPNTPIKVVTIRKTGAGDYRVPGPNKTEAEAYYTDDKDDALATAYAMHGKLIQVKFH